MTGLGEYPPFTPEDLKVIRENRALHLRTLENRWHALDRERANPDYTDDQELLDEQYWLERLIEVFR